MEQELAHLKREEAQCAKELTAAQRLFQQARAIDIPVLEDDDEVQVGPQYEWRPQEFSWVPVAPGHPTPLALMAYNPSPFPPSCPLERVV
jgi:hypothetical protein